MAGMVDAALDHQALHASLAIAITQPATQPTHCACFNLLCLCQQLKERQKEDHMYDNTEKFITSAYRRKLEEDKQWQESQRLKYVLRRGQHSLVALVAKESVCVPAQSCLL